LHGRLQRFPLSLRLSWLPPVLLLSRCSLIFGVSVNRSSGRSCSFVGLSKSDDPNMSACDISNDPESIARLTFKTFKVKAHGTNIFFSGKVSSSKALQMHYHLAPEESDKLGMTTVQSSRYSRRPLLAALDPAPRFDRPRPSRRMSLPFLLKMMNISLLHLSPGLAVSPTHG